MKLDLVSLVQSFGAVYTAPPDAASAGVAPAGGAPSPGAGSGDAPDAGDLESGADDAGDDLGAAADDQNAGDTDDLDALLGDDEDDDQAGQTRTAEDRIKALNAKNRKLRKRLLKSKGTLERLGGVDLDDLITRARQYDALQANAARNPRLRALLSGGDDEDADDRAPARRPGARNHDDDPPFDEAKLPFDPNENEANRYFAGLARDNHELKRTVRQLTARFEQFARQDSARSEATQREQWGSVVTAAAKQISHDGQRKIFRDAVVGAFNNPKIRERYTPQQIVSYYLKELGVQPQQAARANAAARQRVAEKNRTLPRHPAQGGSPAPARNPKETLADVHRRIRHVG
jgi:hypothetical protein